jgi:hypothetical protein
MGSSWQLRGVEQQLKPLGGFPMVCISLEHRTSTSTSSKSYGENKKPGAPGEAPGLWSVAPAGASRYLSVNSVRRFLALSALVLFDVSGLSMP